MKQDADYLPLYGTALFLWAGFISPSNGVDDQSYEAPEEMLSVVVVVISAEIVAFIILKLAAHFGCHPF